MCGIAGFFDGNADFTANREKYENILQKMQQSILHRGPDEQGIYLGKRAGLAHTRLSIIEPAKMASQPRTRSQRPKISYRLFIMARSIMQGNFAKRCSRRDGVFRLHQIQK